MRDKDPAGEAGTMAGQGTRRSGRRGRGGSRKRPDPRKDRLEGGPEAQQQEWPGSDAELSPRPDHGEESYEGTGRLEGKRALITGGDSGIGRAVAIAFAREGADVAIAYLDEDEDAAETLHWIEGSGRTGIAIPGDLAQRDHCRRVVDQTVEAFGGLDIVVNNAAVHWEKRDITEIDEEQLVRTFRTNILSFFWITQAALPHLEAGSSILNTGSVVALRGSPSLLDYSATKGAVHVFTMSLAQALAERGIRVNCVAPGPVWTPLIASTRPAEKVEGFGADTHWDRPAHPAELAPAYVFLASADGRYITGETLAITGGAPTR